MPRTPHAMRVFTDEVTAIRKSAKFEFGEVDGLNAYRQVTFDKATTKFLGAALDHIDDNRMLGYTVDKDQLKVIFSHRSNADLKDPFHVAEAVEVANADKA